MKDKDKTPGLKLFDPALYFLVQPNPFWLRLLCCQPRSFFWYQFSPFFCWKCRSGLWPIILTSQYTSYFQNCHFRNQGRLLGLHETNHLSYKNTTKWLSIQL